MAGFLVLWTVWYIGQYYLDELYVTLAMSDPKEELFQNSEKGKGF